MTLLLAFGVIAVASSRVGAWCSRVGLPSITGYLAVGALAGTFALDLIPTSAAADLRFVDEIALGVIAFVAGSELFLPELRGRWRTIATIGAGITAVGLVVIGGAIFGLAQVLPFTQDMSTSEHVAIAVLGATVLLALSPPSTIAVIKDLGARGPFTSTMLSVTVVMDVVVVVAFAAAASLAAALLHGTGINVGFAGVLLLDLALAVALGVGLGKLLGRFLALRLPLLVTAGGILAAGFAVYELTTFVDTWTRANFAFEIYLEPLLLTMVAGFTVTNFTDERTAFEDVLHDISPAVYVAFFTLTGLALKLDTLLEVLPAAIALFAVRVAAIAIGSRVGASVAGQDGFLRNRSWMALITQAGIALGLAREAGVQFPELGAAFTSLIIAVVVLNEIAGPMVLRRVLTDSGEVEQGVSGHVAVYGASRNAVRLVHDLRADGFTAVLVDDSAAHLVDVTVEDDVDVARLRDTSATALAGLDPRPEVVVAMSGDDHANLEICTAAAAAGVGRTIARVQDPSLLEAFHAVGAMIIDQTGALVALLGQAVRAPDATTLVLHDDPERDVREFLVPDGALAGLQLRDVRLPSGVLVMGVRRRGQVLVPDGFTRLAEGDVLTLVGASSALNAAGAVLTRPVTTSESRRSARAAERLHTRSATAG